MVVIGLLFWIEARIFVFSKLPLTFWELLPYAGIIVLLFYLYSYAPLKQKNKSQGIVQGLDYADSMIRRGKKRPDDIMLPFKEAYHIPIDFSDTTSLTVRFNSNTYRKHRISYLESQLTPNVSEDEQIIIGNDLKSLLTTLTPLLPDLKEKGVFENIIGYDETKSKKQKKQKEVSAPDETLTQEEINTLNEKDLEDLDLTKISEPEKKNLNKLNVYWIKLDSPQNYEDERETWDELFIIIPQFSYKEALATTKGIGFYNKWPVFLKECFCYWEHLFDLTGNIQVLFLTFSENFDKPILEPLKNLKAEAYAFLQLKIMETWMNDLEVKPERLEKTRDHYREKAKALGDTLSDVVQDEAADSIVFSKFLNIPAQNRLKSEIEKYRRRFILAISGIIIVVLTMAFIIASII